MEALIKEFRMLVESDYWQYLSAETKDRILTFLGEDKRLRYQHAENDND